MEEVTKVIEAKPQTKSKPIFDRVLDFLSSFRLRVFLAAILSIIVILGFFIVQKNNSGFDAYYASISSFQKSIYDTLGLFDIFHNWYFYTIIFLLTLNIALAWLDFFSSVRFGIVLLVILVVLSMLGMLVIQQNVSGFDAFYASLMPAEKLVYGYLGFFDIYHSWYYLALLLILSLNIILASIDRFPTAWKFLSTPKTETTKAWLLHQNPNASVKVFDENRVDKISQIFKKYGYGAKVTEKNGRIHIFGEKGRWNRMGAYFVHVALLLLFLGHFVALQTGFDADVRMQPGQTTDQIEEIRFNLDQQERYANKIPFTVTCTDIQQTLIDPKGTIDLNNTMDWRTQIRIDDPDYGTTVADVSLNKPFSYRGFRFFQASAITAGAARTMTIEMTPENGGEPIKIVLERNGETSLPDGTVVRYEHFWSDFVAGQPESSSNEYKNAAVKLKVITPNGEIKDGYAFAVDLPDDAPINKPVGGYKLHLADFEKSPIAHILSIRYDPYSGHFVAWYLGGIGLMAALIFVFFISHQRIWALIDGEDVIVGGNTNRNQLGFEDRFNKITNEIKEL